MKFAVLGLSEALRSELKPHGIGVTAVCPGLINTEITHNTPIRGTGNHDQLRQHVAGIYRKRGYTAERVARNILRAIDRDRAVAPIAAEAHLMYVLSRAVPPLGRWAAAKMADAAKFPPMLRTSATPAHRARTEFGHPVVWRRARAWRKVHQASLYARAAIAARRRGAAGHPDEAEARAGEQLFARLSDLAQHVVSDCRLVKVPGDRPPWVDTGIDVREGEQLSTFAWGRIWMSRFFDIWLGADFQLWARVGEKGPV
ncbi:MAG: SDR family NAD(P)-dependent oxidoreductase, partial [Mycolicibacterium sp.]|nr:SDR family NAD(P)-dependent oxidoreductase [Mycolicibacterium sp.]